jgi:hypothetical protein
MKRIVFHPIHFPMDEFCRQRGLPIQMHGMSILSKALIRDLSAPTKTEGKVADS